MENQSNNGKDIAKSLNNYTDTINKGTNLLLDGANQINKWYAEQLNKISEGEVPKSRLETNVDNTVNTDEVENEIVVNKIETKIEEYNEIQTDNSKNKEPINFVNTNRIKTQIVSDDNIPIEDVITDEISVDDGSIIQDEYSVKSPPSLTTKGNKISKRISTTIKGVKKINNATNKIVRTGKTLSIAMNENGLKSFENSSSRIMTKPAKKVVNKITSKATNKIVKTSKKVVTKSSKKIVKETTNVITKMVKLLVKLIVDSVKIILSMLPSIAPVIIILLIIVTFCSFFGVGMSEETKKAYENYMISTQDEFDKETVPFYNEGKIVDGSIDGKGMINWKAPLSIIQMLNGDLSFDSAELELLETFKNAGLYEQISEVEYTVENEKKEIDENGNEVTTKELATEKKKVITYSSLDDYINWCNNNFDVINKYKQSKKVKYDANQKAFTEDEIEQIKLLYNSTSFFDLFSNTFKEKYAYLSVSIGDEQIKAIYDEFLKNAGKRYLMDHSNLSYDECMNSYDCSSWVIHCLAHTGIARIPNTTASGIYNTYCNPIPESDRKAGDLIFLKDTYDTGIPGGISHIGIYMGELTINGQKDEWIIDTGGNPSGVKITKYKNGWWNGNKFYGFGRLK